MEFKTCEQKVLADLEQAEHDLDLIEQENAKLREEVDRLEKRVIDLGEQATRLMVERDHHADCVKDMLAMAKWYGFDQPQNVAYNPETGGVKAVEQG